MTTNNPTNKKKSKKKSKLPVKKKAKKKSKVKVEKHPPRRNAVGGDGGLTEKQKLFVLYYIGEAGFNASEAARLAKYSEKTANTIGWENLQKPVIAEAVFKAMAELSKKAETSAEWVLERLHKQAVADLRDIYDEETGALLSVHKWPLVWRQGLIVGVDTKEEFEYEDGVKKSVGIVVKVKISERIKRDELIGKHHAMFTENLNVNADMVLKSMTDTELDEKIKNMSKKK